MEIRPGDRVAEIEGGGHVTLREVLARHAAREDAEAAALAAASRPERDAAVVQDGDAYVVVSTEEVEALRTPENAHRALTAAGGSVVGLATGDASTGVTLRGRVDGSARLNEVRAVQGPGGEVSAPGSPEAVAEAELALVARETETLGLGAVERSLRTIDAGAAHLAGGQPDVAAALYRREAQRIRAALPTIEPIVDRSVLELIADNLERRAPLYAVQGSTDGRRAASGLFHAARNAQRLAEMMSDHPEHAEVLRAVGADSMMQAVAVHEQAVAADAALSRSCARATLGRSTRTSSIGPAGSGGRGGAAYNLERTGRYATEARVLTPRAGQHGFPRANDSEVQLLERVAHQLRGNPIRGNPNATGTLRLFTERPPCLSCRRVMSRFRAEHPNITLEVYYLGARTPASIGIGAGTAVDRRTGQE